MHAEYFLPKKTKVVLLLVTHQTRKIDENQKSEEQSPLKIEVPS